MRLLHDAVPVGDSWSYTWTLDIEGVAFFVHEFDQPQANNVSRDEQIVAIETRIRNLHFALGCLLDKARSVAEKAKP